MRNFLIKSAFLAVLLMCFINPPPVVAFEQNNDIKEWQSAPDAPAPVVQMVFDAPDIGVATMKFTYIDYNLTQAPTAPFAYCAKWKDDKPIYKAILNIYSNKQNTTANAPLYRQSSKQVKV